MPVNRHLGSTELHAVAALRARRSVGHVPTRNVGRGPDLAFARDVLRRDARTSRFDGAAGAPTAA